MPNMEIHWTWVRIPPPPQFINYDTRIKANER